MFNQMLSRLCKCMYVDISRSDHIGSHHQHYSNSRTSSHYLSLSSYYYFFYCSLFSLFSSLFTIISTNDGSHLNRLILKIENVMAEIEHYNDFYFTINVVRIIIIIILIIASKLVKMENKVQILITAIVVDFFLVKTIKNAFC